MTQTVAATRSKAALDSGRGEADEAVPKGVEA